MAHFAELDNNNIVGNVVVVADKDTSDENGIEREEIGIAFLKSLYGENTRWVQTSFNHRFRGRFAGRGDTYDPVNNVFVGQIIETNVIDVEEVTPTPALEG